jgi:putative addiction module antidote
MLIESKTRKVGNSVGLILPKEALAHMNLNEGEPVYLTETADGGFRITPYNPEFNQQMQAAESAIHRYRNALRELAK